MAKKQKPEAAPAAKPAESFQDAEVAMPVAKKEERSLGQRIAPPKPAPEFDVSTMSDRLLEATLSAQKRDGKSGHAEFLAKLEGEKKRRSEKQKS